MTLAFPRLAAAAGTLRIAVTGEACILGHSRPPRVSNSGFTLHCPTHRQTHPVPARYTWTRPGPPRLLAKRPLTSERRKSDQRSGRKKEKSEVNHLLGRRRPLGQSRHPPHRRTPRTTRRAAPRRLPCLPDHLFLKTLLHMACPADTAPSATQHSPPSCRQRIPRTTSTR